MIPLSWSGRSADIGALRTHCIGCWTSPSARMTAACATGRRRATSPSFARSLSTWSPETGAPKPASVAGARRLPGTTATCSRSSHAKLMREPWALTLSNNDPIPFVRLAATCPENGFTGLWTGGQFRTALSAEVRSYRARPRRLLPAQSHPLNATDPSICWMLASLAVAGAFRASSALAFGRKIAGPSPVQGKRAVAPVDPTSQRQSALSSLGGVLEHGGCPTAHLVQDLRLVLIRIARGLDRSRGVSYQLADDRNKALTFGRMPVGLHGTRRFPVRG